MLTTIALIGALLTTPQADKWDLKPALEAKATSTWNLTVKVEMGGETHDAALKLISTMKETPADKPKEATMAWKDLMLDGGQSMPDSEWDVKIGEHGAITDGAEAGDDIRRMLQPILFVYPSAPVAVGDTWTETIKAGSDKDDRTMTLEFKADSVEKVGDEDSLKVTEKLSEKGTDTMSSTGTWWVNKAGKVLKFETKVSKWVVPMAGGDPLDATIKGELAK